MVFPTKSHGNTSFWPLDHVTPDMPRKERNAPRSGEFEPLCGQPTGWRGHPSSRDERRFTYADKAWVEGVLTMTLTMASYVMRAPG